MANGELKLPITGDNKDFLKAVKGAGDGAEDLADSLSDLGRSGSRDLDRVTDSLDDVSDHANILSDDWDKVGRDAKASGRQQETALEKVEREARETQQAAEKIGDGFDTARRESERFSRQSGDDLSKTKQTAAEFKSEVSQNIGETFSSFRGDLADLPQIAQDTFGGLATSIGPLLGPAGIIASVAGAAGLGLIAGAMENNGEQTAAFKEKVADLTDALIEAGDAGLSIDYVAGALRDLATATGENEDSLGDLYESYRKSGLSGVTSFKDVAKAVVGAGGDYGKLIEKQETYLRSLRDENGIASAGGYAVKQANSDKIDATQKIIDKLKEQQGVAEEAALAEQAYAASGAEALQQKADIQASASDAIASGYDEVRQAAADAATAEDGAFDVQKYLSAVEAQKVAVGAFKTNLASMKLTPEEWENFFALDDTVQQNLASAFATGSDDLKAQIASSLDDAGSKGGSQAAVKFDSSFKPKDKDVKVNVTTPSAATASADLDKVAKKREAEIEAKSTGKAKANADLDAVAADRTAKIKASVDLSAAQTAIDTFVNKKRTITVTAKAVDQYGRQL
ncbi:hypothetical protein GCM10027515_26560 [Schumannella luteola]|uniref:Uncharacterized protein n=1 Tax=Schumannella luteola TaxID=472059 RepID=A0A852YI20_9MICO|nr:hypothetical protein [Schumannella luteola]NYG99547.1 hypothetical protein [Schumannella luteola]TPX03864.1 hypothetical protein FJ656_15140 [Schumannella luteola]